MERVASELNDLNSLAVTVHNLATLLENKGQSRKAEDLRRQLDDDVAVYAAQFLAPSPHQLPSPKFRRDGEISLNQRDRLAAVLNFRVATILDPENADLHNRLAWTMVNIPGRVPLFPTSRALTSAKKAVELKPTDWMYWNTLGVVAFRSRDWEAASKFLEKSVLLNDGGGAIDWFFLAMTRWHEGKPDLAQELFHRGSDYLKHNPGDHELLQFHSEAKNLLAQPCPNSDAERYAGADDDDLTDTAQNKNQTSQTSSVPLGLLTLPRTAAKNEHPG